MIKKNTVLILGAGASVEYNYPTGAGLKRRIVEKLNQVEYNLPNIRPGQIAIGDSDDIKSSDEKLARYLKLNCFFKDEEILRFRNEFDMTYKQSIDSFLENRDEKYLVLGKILIALSIFECESDGLLFRDSEQNWYKYLLRAMDDGWNDFKKNRVTIITYNYDRSLEYFLVCALSLTYGKPYFDCQELLKNLNFIHVHGAVSSLPYPMGLGKNYNIDVKPQDIHSAVRSLHLIYEEEKVKESYTEVHKALDEAEQIFILGFGFDKRNLERLQLTQFGNKATIFATRTGITDLEIAAINNSVNNRILFSRFEKNGIVSFLRDEINFDGAIAPQTAAFNANMNATSPYRRIS